jgi:hypothetical protein
MASKEVLDPNTCWFKETETGDYVISLGRKRDYRRILSFENELRYHPPSVASFTPKGKERYRDYDYWTNGVSLLVVEKSHLGWADEIVGVGFFDNMIKDEYDTYPPNLDFYGVLPPHRRRVGLGFALGILFFGLKAVKDYYRWGLSIQSDTRPAVITNLQEWLTALNLGLIGNIDDGIDFEMYLRDHCPKDDFIRRCEDVLKSYGWIKSKYPYRSRMRATF